MAHGGGERVEKFQDNMALVRILQNDTKGHKMPFLVNFINTGPILPRRYVLSIPFVCVCVGRGGDCEFAFASKFVNGFYGKN